MKTTYLLLLFSVLTFSAFAQKPTKEQKESLQAAQKRLNERLANMKPEARRMYDSMMNAFGGNKIMNNAINQVNNNTQAGPTGLVLMPTGDPNKIPTAVSKLAIPPTPTDKSKLVAYLKPVFAELSKKMETSHKSAVESLLNKGKQTGQYAMVFWTHNELDKALYLLTNACITTPDDYLSVNNLGALLTMSGYANKSLPLLLYAQKALPESGTLLNNIGQAYLSLGYTDKAKSFLQNSITKDSTNGEAYRSMALIAKSQGNNKLCGGYLQKAIAHGCATSEMINLLNQVTPGVDMSETIRNNFKQFYKDHSITKRFIIPAIPASYEEAVAAYPDINTFFQNLDATVTKAEQDAKTIIKDYEAKGMENINKRMAQMQQVMAKAGKPGFTQSINDMKSSLTNPMLPKAALMMASIDNPKFSKSYFARMKTEAVNRKMAEDDLKQSLKVSYDTRIEKLEKELKTIDAGEGKTAENARVVEIEKELCTLKQERQAKWLSKSAEINNGYIHKMEDLLNQRLQEYLFWNTISMQTIQDPTAVNYSFYVQYLRDLNGFRTFFPYYVDGGLSKPCGEYLKEDNKKGKIHEWEREHCEVEFEIDLMVTGGKMNCEGWSVYADFKAGSFKYERSIDPVTWATTGHSISAKAGKDKEFEITKNIKGSIGASVETTIKFDGHLNPVDLIVKGTVGAEVNGPLGGNAGMNLFTGELSVNGGFNAAGPSIQNLFK